MVESVESREHQFKALHDYSHVTAIRINTLCLLLLEHQRIHPYARHFGTMEQHQTRWNFGTKFHYNYNVCLFRSAVAVSYELAQPSTLSNITRMSNAFHFHLHRSLASINVNCDYEPNETIQCHLHLVHCDNHKSTWNMN